MPVYRHLFFDLDHTLWDFDRNAKTSLQDIFSLFQLQQLENVTFDAFYTKYLFHNAQLWVRYEQGTITAEELKWKRMWRTLMEFKIADETLSKNLSNKFLEILPTKKEVFPHTIEVLNYLKEKNYLLHLITNGFEKTQWSKLKHSGLDSFFTHMITSESSNSIKPHKEIFEFALAKANAGLQESIMIGDNLAADIQGAMNMGMDTIFVNHISAIAQIKPTYTITHLKQLEDIF